MSYFRLNSNRILHRRLLFLVVRTYRQMSTRRSSSGQLHSYISLQLIWLCFINSPSSWSALAGASLQIFWNSSTLAASLYTCFARWYNLKVETAQKENCIIIHYKNIIELCFLSNLSFIWELSRLKVFCRSSPTSPLKALINDNV